MANIFIAKVPGKKDCFDTSKGVPEFLTKNVHIMETKVTCWCIDGKDNTPVKQTGEVGCVIAYEPDEKNITGTGWNCWILGEDYIQERLELVNGVYYTKPVPTLAALCTEELPDFTKGMEIIREDDGSFSFDPGWGDGTILNAKPYEGVWIYYGVRKDGVTPDVNYCKFGTKSSANYIVILDDGSRIPLDDLA